MNLTCCLHTSILVSDLTKATDFYENVLGLSPAPNRQLNFPGIWYQVGNYQIHLIVNSDYVSSKFNQEKWGRNPHVAFQVDDITAAKKKLEEAGYSIQTSASGRAALFIQDPDGNVIELSQG